MSDYLHDPFQTPTPPTVAEVLTQAPRRLLKRIHATEGLAAWCAARGVLPSLAEIEAERARRAQPTPEQPTEKEHDMTDETTNDTAALTPEQVTTARDALAEQLGITDEDRDMLMTGTDVDTLVNQAERLATLPPPLTAGNVAPREGTGENRPRDTSAREFTRNLFGLEA